MGLSCLFGHKWSGLRCERCGRTRRAYDVLAESSLYKCSVCGTTGQHLHEEWDRKQGQHEQLGGGLNLFGFGSVMLFCRHCNAFVCSKCALEGEVFKRCPRCERDFELDALAEESAEPAALLALAAPQAAASGFRAMAQAPAPRATASTPQAPVTGFKALSSAVARAQGNPSPVPGLSHAPATRAETSPPDQSDREIVPVLISLCEAYARNDTAQISRLEPVVTRIGQALDRRGGIQEMRRVFARIPAQQGKRTLEMHWGGIGDWQG